MAPSVPKFSNEILFACIGVITFLLFFGLILWAYRHYKLRGFYLNDYRKLMLEAKILSAETQRVKREVECDFSADEPTKLKNEDILKSAEEWDTGIRMALSAWEDCMQTSKGVPDIENEKASQVVGETKDDIHGHYLIGIMRAKSIEGIERRKDVSSKMGEIVAEIRARRVNDLMSKLNSRAPAGPISKEEVSRPVKCRPVRPSLDQLHCASYESLYHTDRKIVVPPRRAMSCTPEDRKASDDKLNGLGIYI